MNAPSGELTINYRATVELGPDAVDSTDVGETNYELLPADVLSYLNPSLFCESDKLYRFAFEEFGKLLTGYSRITAICNWTYEQLAYTPGSTGPSTTACDATRLAPVGGFVRIGTGRDAADVAFATILGEAQSTGVDVWANAINPNDGLLNPDNVQEGVSSA